MSDYTTTARTNFFRVEPQHTTTFEALVKLLGADECYKRGRFDTGLINLKQREETGTFVELDDITEEYEISSDQTQLLLQAGLITKHDPGYKLEASIENVARCMSSDSIMIYIELVNSAPVSLGGHADAIDHKGQVIAHVSLDDIYDEVLAITGIKPTTAHG